MRPQRSPRSHERSSGWQRQRRGKRGLGIFYGKCTVYCAYSIRTPWIYRSVLITEVFLEKECHQNAMPHHVLRFKARVDPPPVSFRSGGLAPWARRKEAAKWSPKPKKLGRVSAQEGTRRGRQCPKRLRCSHCCGARAWYGTRMPPRMCYRTRQESTSPRLRFSCDLAVARPPVKVAFANIHLIFGVRLEQHKHKTPK